ncbi:MAG: protein translocase subunit SecDF, partial [Chlamydiia bacterium]|nr:protein translocase subunit SecDF [Chlamydiia bacterium]
MEKQKRWQFVLITIVLLLTIYNILPTVLFYSKPLNDPIKEKQATVVAHGAANRVNDLEKQSIDWLKSYNKLLGIKGATVTLDADNPEMIHVKYANEKDADIVRKHLPRAGSLIPFVPAQLSLVPNEKEHDGSLVTIQRKIPVHFAPSELNHYFTFTEKRNVEGNISPLYHKIIDDRLVQLGIAVGGISENA